MTRPMFFKLVNSVQFDLKYDTKRNHALTAAQQLMIALRFFASGSFQQVIGDTINVNINTVCRTIARVTKALLKQQKTIIFWPTQEECARSALKLHENHSFPCVEGIVDGTHIPILRPNIHEEAYVNRKDFHSINVQISGNGDLQNGPDQCMIRGFSRIQSYMRNLGKENYLLYLMALFLVIPVTHCWSGC